MSKTLNIKAQLRQASEDLLTPTARKHRNKRVAMGVVVSGLLCGSASAQQAGDWQIRTALLLYAEADRVQAIEPVLQATRYFDDERSFSSKLVLDALTGASANGAVPSDQPQTFTRPSGKGRFTIAPGETPLDDTFHDTRVALSANWAQPLLKALSGNVGLNISNEYDYLSLGINGRLNFDFNDKNTTATVGLAFASDSIEPEGGIPTAGAEVAYFRGDPNDISNQFNDNSEGDGRESSQTKNVSDLQLGLTQIINRRSLLQLNYSLSLASGYMSDPFKMVSVVDISNGQPQSQLYENRPDQRSKQALYMQYKQALGQDDVLDLSYRYLWDDWGISSHTLDMHYRISFGQQFLRPHLRLYSQTASDFYHPFVLNNTAAPELLSADYRLGELSTVTVGLEYGRTLNSGTSWRVALEYYLQSSQEPGNKPGQLKQQTVNPDVDAIMLRSNFDFDW